MKYLFKTWPLFDWVFATFLLICKNFLYFQVTNFFWLYVLQASFALWIAFPPFLMVSFDEKFLIFSSVCQYFSSMLWPVLKILAYSEVMKIFSLLSFEALF